MHAVGKIVFLSEKSDCLHLLNYLITIIINEIILVHFVAATILRTLLIFKMGILENLTLKKIIANNTLHVCQKQRTGFQVSIFFTTPDATAAAQWGNILPHCRLGES